MTMAKNNMFGVSKIEWVDGSVLIDQQKIYRNDDMSYCKTYFEINGLHRYKADFKKTQPDINLMRGLYFYNDLLTPLDNRNLAYKDGIREFTVPLNSKYVRIASTYSQFKNSISLYDIDDEKYIFKNGIYFSKSRDI